MVPIVWRSTVDVKLLDVELLAKAVMELRRDISRMTIEAEIYRLVGTKENQASVDVVARFTASVCEAEG